MTTMGEPDRRPKKRYTRVNPFAVSDIAREFGLTASEAWLLQLVAMQGEYRSGEWTGTIADLSAATRFSRNTVPRVVAELTRKGRLKVLAPFRQGADGRVLVVDFGRIVAGVPRSQNAQNDANQNAQDDANEAGQDRAEIAHRSRSDRAVIAQDGAIDQGEHGGREVQRHRGSGDDGTGPRCVCGAPMAGHPFDHEPVLQNDDDPEEPDAPAEDVDAPWVERIAVVQR